MSVSLEVRDIFRRWIARADGHLEAARVLVREGGPATFDAACYHCHEAVATLFKAALTLHGVVMPRVHDLEYLHRLLPEEHRFAASASDLSWLSTYGIERWWEPDAAQARRALDVALTVRSAAGELFRCKVDPAAMCCFNDGTSP